MIDGTASDLKKEQKFNERLAVDCRLYGTLSGMIGIVFSYLAACSYSTWDVFPLVMWGVCALYWVLKFCAYWIGHFEALRRIEDIAQQLHDINSRESIDKL